MTHRLLAQTPAATFGSESLDLGSAYTLRDGQPVSKVFDEPADLVNLLVPNLFVVAGIAVVVLFILAGYKYIAQGEKGIQEAQKVFTAAIAGLVVMFAAYWIVQIIKGITGADIPL